MKDFLSDNFDRPILHPSIKENEDAINRVITL